MGATLALAKRHDNRQVDNNNNNAFPLVVAALCKLALHSLYVFLV